MPGAFKVFVHGLQYQRAAQLLLSSVNVVAAEPVSRDNAVVQRLVHVVIVNATAEAEAHEARCFGGSPPELHGDDGFRLEAPGSLFLDFAFDGVDQVFAVFQMSGWLIERKPACRCLFHQKKTLVSLDNRGNGNVWFPDHPVDI